MAKLSISTIIEEVMSAISLAAYHPHRQDVHAFVDDPSDASVIDREQYIVAEVGVAQGVFVGNENLFGTRINNVWSYVTPRVDVLVYLLDEERLVTWTGTVWQDADIGILADTPPTGGTAFDDPAAAGTDRNASRHDHVHAMAAPTAGITTQVTSATTTSDEGSNSAPARADHSHGMTVNMTQVAGAITDVQHSTRTGGNLHALAIPSGAAGFMSGIDKTTLDNLAANPGGGFAAVSTAAIANQPIESGTVLEVMEDFASYGSPTWTRTSATTLTCTKAGLYSLSGEILFYGAFANQTIQMWIKKSGNVIKTTWFSLADSGDSVEYGLWFDAVAGDTLILEIGQGPSLGDGARIDADNGGNPTHGTQLRMTFIQ